MMSTRFSALLLLCLAALSEQYALTLKYFDAKGAAEVTRVLLALGDMSYEDSRYKIEVKEGGGFATPGFTADKESGALASNMNRAPVMLIDGQLLGQSKAMERFVAAQAGLLGSSAVEAAIIDSVSEHVRDVRDAQRAKGFSAFSRDKTDEEKAAAKAEWFDDDLPSWLLRLEACVAPIEEIVCGGDKPTYAAVCVWALLREGSTEDVELTSKAAAGCPTLNKMADAVAHHPKVVGWMQSRPATMF